MRKGKATSLEVAHLAGVSQPTVSRALRGSPTVNEATRKRIQAIADELNYKVDRNASKLRAQHTDTLALLFFEDPTLDDSLINPFFLSMLGSITRACAIHGYDLLISFQQLSGNWLADFQDSKKADGIILLGYGDYLEYLSKLEQLVAQGTRFVRWGAVLPGQPGSRSAATITKAGAVSRVISSRSVAVASRFSVMRQITIRNFWNAIEGTSSCSKSTAWPFRRPCTSTP